MNPKLVEPFELQEDDFLPARPARLQLVGLLSEIDPPGWALKCITKIGGKRHPKREKFVSSQSAVVPWRPSAYQPIGPMGPMGPPGPNPDAEEAYNKALSRRRRKQQSKAQQQTQTPVPAGNLCEDDYRFWKGYALEESEKNHGICRWCSTHCLSREAMLKHHNESNYCKQHLLALYRYAVKSSRQRYCFACKQETQERRWGIPLCKRQTCISRWKFTFTAYLPGFQHYRTWATNAQIQDPVNGPFKDLPASSLSDDTEEDFTGAAC
jgi:hypothetical protein